MYAMKRFKDCNTKLDLAEHVPLSIQLISKKETYISCKLIRIDFNGKCTSVTLNLV